MRRLAASLLVLLLALPALAESWAELYDKGKAAVEQGSYSQGRDMLLAALGEKRDEGRIRIGMKSWEYYPSHYLAKAYLGLGQLDDAEKYLRAAEAVKDQSAGEKALLGELRRQFEAARRTAAAAPPAATPPATAPPPVATAPTTSANAELARKAFADGDVGTARRLAEAALAENPQDRAAKDVLESARAYTKAKIGAARDALAAEDFAAAEADVRDALKADPQSAEALALRDEVKSRRAASAAPTGATGARPAPTAPQVAVATPPRVEPPRGATAPAPPPLPPVVPAGSSLTRDAETQRAYESFFRGEVPAAVAALEAVTAGGGTAESLAVLGAARATLGLLAGEDAKGREMAAARELFRKALAKDSRVRLDRRYFSPRILDIFEEVRSKG